jgi:hypothetical protein
LFEPLKKILPSQYPVLKPVSLMTAIAFLNQKGGVGKTTLRRMSPAKTTLAMQFVPIRIALLEAKVQPEFGLNALWSGMGFSGETALRCPE